MDGFSTPVPTPFMKLTLTVEDYVEIVYYLTAGEFPADLDKAQRRTFLRRAQQFCMVDDKLYGVEGNTHLRVVPDNDPVALSAALQELHMPNHIGMKGMYESACWLAGDPPQRRYQS